MKQPLDDILDSLREGVLVIDRDHTIIYANSMAEKIYAGLPGGLVGEKCHTVFYRNILPCPHLDHHGKQCPFQEVFRTGQPVTVKHPHMMPEGVTRLFEISAAPLRDEMGAVDRIIQVFRDVSTEEALKEELVDSNLTLEMISNNTPIVINFIDKEMRSIRLNPAMEAMMGMKSEEVLGKYCYDCWGQYAHDESRHGRERICEGCQVPSVLLDGRTRSHERRVGDRIFEVVTNPVRDADGTIIGAMKQGLDITERCKDRMALQQSEQRFRSILDSTPDVIFAVNCKARIVDVNERAIHTLGYSRTELLQMGIEDIDPDFSPQWRQEAIWDRLGPGETITIMRRHRRKDGFIFPVEIHLGKTVLDGQPVILSLIRDVSERERAKQALRESENTYRALFESSPNVLCIADFSGLRKYLAELSAGCVFDYEVFFQENPRELAAAMSQLRLFKANQAALDLFGAAVQEELPEGLFTIIGPETVVQTLGGISAIGRGELSFEHEVLLYHLQTGEKIYCIIRWNVVPGYETNYQQVILSLTDISSRKIAEDKLAEHREQLRKLSARLIETEEAERRRIVRELHDKLGQQLTALGLNLDLLEQSLPPEQVLAQRKRFFDMSGLMEEMTEQVRDIMADLRPPVLDDYGLGAALRWYGEIFSNRTGIEVLVGGGDVPRFPLALELALFRVMQEALTNVAKHSGASEVAIYYRVDSCRLTLGIMDNGQGFEPAGGKMMYGSGFGLISMRERVESFGGIFRVDSQPGTGASIVVEVDI